MQTEKEGDELDFRVIVRDEKSNRTKSFGVFNSGKVSLDNIFKKIKEAVSKL